MSPTDPLQPTERRRWLRVTEELLIACYGYGHSSDVVYFTRNFSGGGLMFETPEAIALGTRLEIACYTPTNCERRVMQYMLIGAHVQWTCEIPEAFEYEGSNRYRIGVAFDEVDSEAQACLDEYVNKRLVMASAQRVT